MVTPNTRSSRNGGIAPVYIRAVSNTGTSPRFCANATALRLVLGTSRKIRKACSTRASSLIRGASGQKKLFRLDALVIVVTLRPLCANSAYSYIECYGMLFHLKLIGYAHAGQVTLSEGPPLRSRPDVDDCIVNFHQR